MGRAVRKINFLVEEKLCQALTELVPAGKRSQVINEALRRELDLIRRRRAVEDIVAQAASGGKFSNQEITESLTEDRRRR